MNGGRVLFVAVPHEEEEEEESRLQAHRKGKSPSGACEMWLGNGLSFKIGNCFAECTNGHFLNQNIEMLCGEKEQMAYRPPAINETGDKYRGFGLGNNEWSNE